MAWPHHQQQRRQPRPQLDRGAAGDDEQERERQVRAAQRGGGQLGHAHAQFGLHPSCADAGRVEAARPSSSASCRSAVAALQHQVRQHHQPAHGPDTVFHARGDPDRRRPERLEGRGHEQHSRRRRTITGAVSAAALRSASPRVRRPGASKACPRRRPAAPASTIAVSSNAECVTMNGKKRPPWPPAVRKPATAPPPSGRCRPA